MCHTNPCVLELEVPAIAPDLEQTSQLALCPALLSEWSLEESPCLLESKDILFYYITGHNINIKVEYS
jgi:hypothetical protein